MPTELLLNLLKEETHGPDGTCTNEYCLMCAALDETI